MIWFYCVQSCLSFAYIVLINISEFFCFVLWFICIALVIPYGFHIRHIGFKTFWICCWKGTSWYCLSFSLCMVIGGRFLFFHSQCHSGALFFFKMKLPFYVIGLLDFRNVSSARCGFSVPTVNRVRISKSRNNVILTIK